MIGKILVILLGIFIVGVGIWYNKKYHNEKFVDTSSSSTGSFFGDIIATFFLFVIGILPWYVFKTVIILIGLLFIYIGIVNWNY